MLEIFFKKAEDTVVDSESIYCVHSTLDPDIMIMNMAHLNQLIRLKIWQLFIMQAAILHRSAVSLLDAHICTERLCLI